MDIFISHSSADNDLVKNVCTILKENGISYWVDYENRDFGDPFSASIVEKLSESKIMLLFITKASNTSKQVLREVSFADNHNIPIIPVVVGDLILSKEFEYYFSGEHMLTYSSSPKFNATLIRVIKEKISKPISIFFPLNSYLANPYPTIAQTTTLIKVGIPAINTESLKVFQ